MSSAAKARPSAWWLILPLVMILTAGGLFVWQLVAFFSFLDDVHQVDPPQQIEVTDDGFTLMVEGDPASSGFLTAPACALIGSDEQRHTLERTDSRTEVTTHAKSWSGWLNSPSGLAPGNYRLECPRAGQYAIAPKVDAGGIALGVIVGVLVPIGLGAVAFLILIIWAVMRIVDHNKRRQARVQQYPPTGYGPTSDPAGSPSGYEPPRSWQPPHDPSSPPQP